MKTVSVFLFGSPRIQRQKQPVEMDTRKAMALLAYLAVTKIPHTRDSLSVLLYPELDQSHARAALRRTISSLKQALNSDSLVVSGDTLSLVNDDTWVDVRDFSRLIAEWKSHAHLDEDLCEVCTPILKRAVDLYRGDFLSGFTLRDSTNFDDWQFFQTESYKKDLAGLFTYLVPALCVQGSYDPAIAYARQWLSLDALNEEAHRALMRCYALSGQQGAALRQYRECVRILDQELGVSPIDETTQLYRLILEHHLKPQLEKPTVEFSQGHSPPFREVRPISTNFPLVGREIELNEIRWSYQWSATKGCFFVIEGEMGIGKSRLAEEFLFPLPAQNVSILRARCFEGESELAYAPFLDGLQTIYPKGEVSKKLKGMPVRWLSQASLLLPEISADFSDLTDPNLQTSPTQANFFEGLRRIILRLLGGNPPGVIFLDDLQWADTASLDLLSYLVRRSDSHPLFILGTWRDEGSSVDKRIHQILAEAQRYGTAKFQHLERLSEENFQVLVANALMDRSNIPELFTHRLYQETEGVPFIAVEYLNKVITDSEFTGSFWDHKDQWDLPENVRDALQTRLSRISDIGWQLLSTGAVLGRSFDFLNLMNASGRSETETLVGLEELLHRGIVKERTKNEFPGQVEFDFSHEKIRQLVYEQTSLSRRRIMHRRVAEVLIDGGRGARKPNVPASIIAQHFQLSGELDKAAEYYFLAGENARSLFAHREAVASYRAALTYGYPNQAGLQEAIGDSQAMLGEYQAALDSFNTAVAFSSQEEMPRLEIKLGNIHHRLGEFELAICYFQTAANSKTTDAEPSFLARVYADWSRSAYFLKNIDQAQHYADQALELAEKAGDLQAIAQVLNIQGILTRNSGQPELAQTHLTRSLEIAHQLQDVMIIPTALNNLALLHASQGDLRQAISMIEEALEYCERIGDRHLEAALHNNLADFLHASGETDLALEQIRKAVVIFAEIGIQAGEIVPEVWKLAEW